MCDGIVIDGHMLPELSGELARDSGSLYDIVDWIIYNCGIAINDYIETHWRRHRSDTDVIFWEWFREQVENHTIHYVTKRRLDSHTKKKLHNEYGLPNGPFVRAYIECAYGTNEPRYILAEDMDLHDPKARREETETQIKRRENRSGALCVYLERQLGIRVGTLADCKSYFSIDQGPCPNKNKIRIGQNQCPKLPNP